MQMRQPGRDLLALDSSHDPQGHALQPLLDNRRLRTRQSVKGNRRRRSQQSLRRPQNRQLLDKVRESVLAAELRREGAVHSPIVIEQPAGNMLSRAAWSSANKNR